MKKTKIILSTIGVCALFFGAYTYVNAQNDDEVLHEPAVEGAPDKGLTLSEMTEDRVYYRYEYDESLTKEENEQLLMEQVLREIHEEMCKEEGCNPDDFEPIDEADVVDSGVIK